MSKRKRSVPPGPWIQLSNGRPFYFRAPSPALITPAVLGGSLSKLCRFTGHSAAFYSVAQHSVLVSKLVPREFALVGLLHDAAEAFIGDMSSPLKSLMGPEFHQIEARISAAVAQAFRIKNWGAAYPQVKQADLTALATEARDLLGGGELWAGLPEPHPTKIVPLGPKKAEALFLRRLKEIS